MKYLLGIDFGGGASKATLLREDGVIVCETSAEYPTHHPTPDASEQSPADWIDVLCRSTKELFAESGVSPSDILAVAVDSATHTAVLCDENFVPLRPAIHWTDARSRAEAKYLDAEYGGEIFQKTFHRPDTIWTLPQLLWLKNHEPDVHGRIKHIFFEKDYIRRFLTGSYETDFIEAEGSMLFDCVKTAWDAHLVSLSGLSADVLPPIVDPKDIVGKVTPDASEATGLAEGTPVICGTTDTVMEVFAAGAVRERDVTVKLATAGRICVITGKPYPDRHLVTYSHIEKGLWYPGTATKAAASSYRWYRDTFCSDGSGSMRGDYRELNKGAASVPIGCEGLIFHPYLNGELTPYADPMLCGSFTGIRATHTKAHFTRAVLEGVSLSLLDSKLYLDGLGIPYNRRAVLIGGGAKGELWRQITADALGMELVTTESSDSSLGSAMLAGIAVGVFESPTDAVKKCVREKSVTLPDPANTERYAEIFKTYKQIHDALAPIYRER
ncbi:MAG: xylulokinase [Firmicutes bacterium]|nr:xylulokinase [Candidatus Colimorpha enterica]